MSLGHGLAAPWPYLGIDRLTEGTVKGWIMDNTDRQHVFLNSDEYAEHADALERYIRGVLGPIFEG